MASLSGRLIVASCPRDPFDLRQFTDDDERDAGAVHRTSPSSGGPRTGERRIGPVGPAQNYVGLELSCIVKAQDFRVSPAQPSACALFVVATAADVVVMERDDTVAVIRRAADDDERVGWDVT